MTKSKCGLFFTNFAHVILPYCTIKITSCSIQHAARTRRNYPDNVACNLLHEKDGIKQTMCLKARSLLGHFYPSTKMNGKVFRASRCTLRESKT
ncbi:hypothetical protein HMPREF9065_00529 [Aggregatibacter sp. oral taxon 458 str. W10330]|nr:hypothetical protein HMPREF9065_00529 [Aggregatibacter sp. oral taxon 458 str. W10330]